eukprot:gnl/MRDRNA2_/MRDRNA2_162466_c0_seq1.p1 gnl/MRDRNA2_/MRDRNA2_162466_c0~~gnl/MRDRNA2_/MRDRNA2_162466_c0_seq1.p1  ORF type:complete len:180 (+),score=37.10 gnl/MRDRNA2_/MRDRNA2_162466_c0_seq1:70-609(+)
MLLNKEAKHDCGSIRPEPRAGEVTMYDSATLHFGTPNKKDSIRVVLNLNLAGSQGSGITEENYGGYFVASSSSQRTLRVLDWMREAFGPDFFARAAEATSMQKLLTSQLAHLPPPEDHTDTMMEARSASSKTVLIGAVVAAVVGLAGVLVWSMRGKGYNAGAGKSPNCAGGARGKKKKQ